jgi:hypothetical protein
LWRLQAGPVKKYFAVIAEASFAGPGAEQGCVLAAPVMIQKWPAK